LSKNTLLPHTAFRRFCPLGKVNYQTEVDIFIDILANMLPKM